MNFKIQFLIKSIYYFCALWFLFAIVFLNGCQNDNYNMEDFYKVEKIDAHVHLNSNNSSWIELAKEDNFKLLSINVYYSDFNPVEEQYAFSLKHLKEDPTVFAFVSTFHMSGWDDPNWVDEVISHLDSTFSEGAVAVKIWKNIGMEFRDKGGNLVMIDNPRFDPIFNHIKEKGIVLIGHLGEPKDCWLPVDQMINNDSKEYFTSHPQYHMYLYPDLPSYEDQINARNKMLDKHKDIAFMGAHTGSLEWSLAELENFFDNYENAVVDLGARMGYLQYHAAIDWENTRNLCINYSDRILYATDNVQASDDDPKIFKEEAHKKWITDWKFLNTDSTMQSKDIDLPFKGLALPRNVIDKIYRENAVKLFQKAWR
ncbi:MAG: amidohydrolase family protein [Candidatus Kariarchaeaceae archaeon]|jgi:predicted TIM-barrel fold metal-dependent hydrolase